MEKENRWNVSREQGEMYIIEVFNEILGKYTEPIRADILSRQMSQLANQRKFLLYLNGRKRNLNYYLRGNYIKLSNFMELHQDKYIVTKRKNVMFVEINEHWIDNEKWTLLN